MSPFPREKCECPLFRAGLVGPGTPSLYMSLAGGDRPTSGEGSPHSKKSKANAAKHPRTLNPKGRSLDGELHGVQERVALHLEEEQVGSRRQALWRLEVVLVKRLRTSLEAEEAVGVGVPRVLGRQEVARVRERGDADRLDADGRGRYVAAGVEQRQLDRDGAPGLLRRLLIGQHPDAVGDVQQRRGLGVLE